VVVGCEWTGVPRGSVSQRVANFSRSGGRAQWQWASEPAERTIAAQLGRPAEDRRGHYLLRLEDWQLSYRDETSGYLVYPNRDNSGLRVNSVNKPWSFDTNRPTLRFDANALAGAKFADHLQVTNEIGECPGVKL
jgi:hypothetical protein